MDITYLRPKFTEQLFNLLNEDRSINLISLKGNGASKLLVDLKTFAESKEGILVYKADIKEFKHNYNGLLEVFRGVNLYKELNNNNSLPAIINQEVLGCKIFLLLDNFDSILDDKQQRFPKSFFDDLNSIKHTPNISICCVTEKPHTHYNIYYLDEKGQLENTLSWLDLMLLDLPSLEIFEIRDELNNKLSNNIGWQNEQLKEDFVKDIFKNCYGFNSYALLKLFCDDFIQNPNYSLSEVRINRVRKRLREDFTRKPKSIFNLDSFMKRIKDFLEIISLGKDLTKLK
jgi:hypothetical protein